MTTSPVSAIRCGPWKLLKHYEDGRRELYNLAEDLGEQKDLAKQFPDRAERMYKQLQAWLASVDAQMPSVNPNFKPR